MHVFCTSARVWSLPQGLLPSHQEEYSFLGFIPTNKQTNKQTIVQWLGWVFETQERKKERKKHTPPVCVPAVLGELAVWQLNTRKKKWRSRKTNKQTNLQTIAAQLHLANVKGRAFLGHDQENLVDFLIFCLGHRWFRTAGTIDLSTNSSEPTSECGLRNRENPSEPTTPLPSPQYGKSQSSKHVIPSVDLTFLIFRISWPLMKNQKI